MEESSENREKLVFLETFGCQMNDNDSERMLGILKGINFARTDDPNCADLILINTCTVRDKAEQKVYSTLGRYKELKRGRPGLIIGIAGCVAQQQGEKLLKRAPHLDMVFGPHNVHKLRELLLEADSGRRVVATALTEAIDAGEYGAAPEASGEKAFVSIMRGCNNFCSYCIVPYTRGREVSRLSADIISEIEGLCAKGVKEVTLLGQNVNSYSTSGGGDVSFPALLGMVCSLKGLLRVRFMTSHPKDIGAELIELFGAEKKLCRHLHLPVQSGSDRILEKMGRGYTVSEYLSKIERIKALYPDMAITTDIIAGFPGETAEDFEATMALVRRARFDNIFAFMYSLRPGTAAASFDGQLSVEVRTRRLQALLDEQRVITLEKNRDLIGRTVEVLVEGPSRGDASRMMGKTQCNRIVNIACPPGLDVLQGSIMEAVVTDASPNTLSAEAKTGNH
ncbi:MAG: tRNA (N6-isopentenyl adenosine(37)-C2)-methylthiotransferase MiaB [Deltaproteobacteria bacterium]|nr:tRNA (N6-isopentenyl adenosine(37)-C2)-methylthiotransferase MiaB [Deltaproteobacteria bacterium]